MHKFSFVPALRSSAVIVCFTSDDWITTSRQYNAVFTTCCYGSWAPLIWFYCFLGNKVTHCITQQPYQFTLCVLRCTLMDLRFRFIWLFLNEAMGCRKSEFRWGKWNLMFVMLSCKYKTTAMHLNSAVQWVCKSMGPVFVCTEKRECCVHVNWWVNHCEDNTQAVSLLLQAMVRAEREKMLWRVACNYHGSLPRLDRTLTQPAT